MRAFLVVATLSLASFAAQAAQPLYNLSGRWKGAGTTTDSRGTSQPCGNIEIVIEQTDKKFDIVSYKAACSWLQPDWGPWKTEIEGTKLMEDGEQVGEFTDDILKMWTGGGASYAMNFRYIPSGDDGTPTLRSYYGVRNLVGAIVIEGDLKQISR
jgi:hypothetical protein